MMQQSCRSLELTFSRIRSLGRRSSSRSPELPGRSNNSSRSPHDGPYAAEILPGPSRFLSSSMSRSHQKSLSSGRSGLISDYVRQFSSISERDDISLEEDAERKAGWLLKLIFVGTASIVGYQFFPYMGDNLLQQSISLLHVKDPLFKRMGASRLSRFAVDDERRMKVVEMGGAQELLNMLEAAEDDKTRSEALKALFALSHCDEAMEFLHQASAIPIIHSTPNSMELAEVEIYKSSLLMRFQELKHDVTLVEGKV